MFVCVCVQWPYEQYDFFLFRFEAFVIIINDGSMFTDDDDNCFSFHFIVHLLCCVLYSLKYFKEPLPDSVEQTFISSTKKKEKKSLSVHHCRSFCIRSNNFFFSICHFLSFISLNFGLLFVCLMMMMKQKTKNNLYLSIALSIIRNYYYYYFNLEISDYFVVFFSLGCCILSIDFFLFIQFSWNIKKLPESFFLEEKISNVHYITTGKHRFWVRCRFFFKFQFDNDDNNRLLLFWKEENFVTFFFHWKKIFFQMTGSMIYVSLKWNFW